jgi:hypothetical protein
MSDVDGWVEDRFPYDGPHDPDKVIEAAMAIRELTRYISNATRHRHTLEWAATVRRVTNTLAGATWLQDEVLDRLADGMTRLAGDPTLYHEDTPSRDRAGGDPKAAATAREAARVLGEARKAVRVSATALDTVAQTVYPLGNE